MSAKDNSEQIFSLFIEKWSCGFSLLLDQPKARVRTSFPSSLSPNSLYLASPLYLTTLAMTLENYCQLVTRGLFVLFCFTTVLCQHQAHLSFYIQIQLKVYNQFKFLKPQTTYLIDYLTLYAFKYIHSGPGTEYYSIKFEAMNMSDLSSFTS